MPKRFNNLKAALSYLKPATGTGTAAEPPATSQLKKFKDFYTRAAEVNYTRAPASRPGKILETTVLPFSVSYDSDRAVVPISQRARDAISTVGLTQATLGIRDRTADDIDYDNFTPAKAIVIRSGTPSTTGTPSQITGRNYKKSNNTTFVLPYGQGGATGATSQEIVHVKQAAITTAVATAASGRKVRFTPEKYSA